MVRKIEAALHDPTVALVAWIINRERRVYCGNKTGLILLLEMRQVARKSMQPSVFYSPVSA